MDKPSRLFEQLRAGGIVRPRTTIREARRAGLRLELGCALLEMESAGGHNVYGHDSTIFRGAGAVTRSNYARYKQQRVASGNRSMQGVGPCQLTWWELQDAADAAGGCWRPEINMRVGFSHLAALVSRYGDSDGARRYSGSGGGPTADAYSRDLLRKADRWKAIIDGARSTRPATVEHPGPARRPSPEASKVRAMEADLEKLEAETYRSWRSLVAYGHRRRRELQLQHRATSSSGVPELVRAVEAGQEEVRRLREELIDRYARAEAQLARLGSSASRHTATRAGTRLPPAGSGVAAWRDEVICVRTGARGLLVRRSKVALARYLADRGGPGHARLGRRLRREATASRTANVASPLWLQAVNAAHEIAALPRSGELDTRLMSTLLPYWPRDHVFKRLLRVTPAWRLVPGQVTRNFNVREFACNDAAGTPYVDGLVNEHRLTRKEATARARELAARLERVRRMNDAQPLVVACAFRHKATDDASDRSRRRLDHQRGFAVDVPRPPGVTLSRHAEHMRLAFESASICQAGHAFVHGSFESADAQSPRRLSFGDRERDPRGGRTIVTRLGDRGVFVRRSKIALSRYLARQGSPAHAALRRRLRREAATPRTGDVASPAWGRAVEAAQRAAGRPVSGELDGEFTRVLLHFWPRDPIVIRALRRTPAWRAIPGQLTPNFNVKELACKDGAHTAYVAGLIREQGLSKKHARARAKALAERLEYLRRLGGDRPLVIASAFRTRAYNASLHGSATNSAHVRGFAVDTQPPRGISLEQHRQHVLQTFECGVGSYPVGRGSFIHGDFDTTLGGRRTW